MNQQNQTVSHPVLTTIAASMSAPLKKPPTRPQSAIRSQMLRRMIIPITTPRTKAALIQRTQLQPLSIQPHASDNEQMTDMVKIATIDAPMQGKSFTPQRAIKIPRIMQKMPKSHMFSSSQLPYFSSRSSALSWIQSNWSSIMSRRSCS